MFLRRKKEEEAERAVPLDSDLYYEILDVIAKYEEEYIDDKEIEYDKSFSHWANFFVRSRISKIEENTVFGNPKIDIRERECDGSDGERMYSINIDIIRKHNEPYRYWFTIFSKSYNTDPDEKYIYLTYDEIYRVLSIWYNNEDHYLDSTIIEMINGYLSYQYDNTVFIRAGAINECKTTEGIHKTFQLENIDFLSIYYHSRLS